MAAMSVELQSAYILHTRPYRDTSMLVDFLTLDYGRVTAVVRGVRSRKTSKRNLLNPFARLLITFQGKSDLKLLTHFESEHVAFSLSAKHLYSGFYLNELLMRLMPELDAHQDIYYLYEMALQQLSQQSEIEPVLRHFELCLLESLGYGIDFSSDAKSGQPILTHQFYCLESLGGFYLAADFMPEQAKISGHHILAIGKHNYELPDVRHTAKRITRYLLKSYLGNKPLMSRELFN